MFARVVLFTPPYGPFTYSLPPEIPAEFWQPGLRVIVPVAKTRRAGYIADIQPDSGLPDTIGCKDIIFPLELEPAINSELMTMSANLARRQGLHPGEVLGHILPAGLRSPRLVIRRAGSSRTLDLETLLHLPKAELPAILQELIAREAQYITAGIDAAEIELYSCKVDPPWPLRPAATRQRKILDAIWQEGEVSKRRLLNLLGSGVGQHLKTLTAKGLLATRIAEADLIEDDSLLAPPDAQFALNPEQETALKELLEAFERETPEYRLLHGVTGSGKTAVYMQLARKSLEKGRSVLLLAPEVALAHKLYKDVNQNLSDYRRFLYHGYQSQVKREMIFRQLASMKEPGIVVGTRSAIFLPLFKPGCIILDEEHDGSYKQEENLPYHAKELAWLRANLNKGLLVLGSATPDLRTFFASSNSVLPRLNLKNRASGSAMPPIELFQLGSKTMNTADGTLLSEELEGSLLDCMKAGEQAVILLNRRGYAPIIFCVACQRPLRCPHCQIGLSFHKSSSNAVCHYCGYTIPWPSPCPQCGGNNFITMGTGTERIAERLEALSGQPVLRLDRDNVRRPGKIQEIMASFAKNESPFLVGTQMLSKGHHFPDVTLVVVADGDIGLNLPDYRAAERTFQLIVQAAGRAGRGAKPGRAIIQTRDPSHYCWQHIVRYDYEGFYEKELAFRKKYLYPPFTKLGLLRISFPVDNTGGDEACKELGKFLREKAREAKVRFLGPTPAPMAVINGKKRMQCLMKSPDWEGMRQLWKWARTHPAAKTLSIFLDLDPVNML